MKKYQKKRLTMLSVSLSMAFGVGANGAQLDEIIVTAQKRVQDIQDVPVAVAIKPPSVQPSGHNWRLCWGHLGGCTGGGAPRKNPRKT